MVALSLCRYYWKAILRNKLEAAAQDAVAIKIESPARSLAAPRGDSIKIMRPASHCNNKTQRAEPGEKRPRENGLRALYSSYTPPPTAAAANFD